MKSDINIDPILRGLIKEAADEVGILTSQGIDAYKITMQLFGKQIRAKKPVLIYNMGLFFISPYKTHRRITRMIQSMRNFESGKDPKGMTREQVIERLKIYWPYHLIARAHLRRTGKRYRARLRKEQKTAENNGRNSKT